VGNTTQIPLQRKIAQSTGVLKAGKIFFDRSLSSAQLRLGCPLEEVVQLADSPDYRTSEIISK
jgi:hypothetical protein